MNTNRSISEGRALHGEVDFDFLTSPKLKYFVYIVLQTIYTKCSDRDFKDHISLKDVEGKKSS